MPTRSVVQEFPDDVDWVNVSERPSLASLRGRVVLLVFFGYDSIHSINLIPALRQLQTKYHDGVAVLGIHVPKYAAQRDKAVVLKAANRLHLRFPVANDADWVLWRQLEIEAWPSVLVLDCEGQQAARVQGDDCVRQLDELVAALLDEAAARDLRRFDPAPTSSRPEPRLTLRFPGALALAGERLYVSDSAHNRVLECNREGRVLRQFGSGNPGYWDGHSTDAGFCDPQGLVLLGDALFVADTGNHAVRRIRLLTSDVTTVLGRGELGYDAPRGGVAGTDLAISAPVGVAASADRLYVSLAGQHQIWQLHLGDGRVDVLAGSGLADVVDGEARSAAFAQPAALALLTGQLLVADAGGNALRAVRLADGMVSTLAGAGRWHPGKGESGACLAHPLAVGVDGAGHVFIADTLNDRVVVYAGTGTGAGAGVRVLKLGERLHEPAGLCVDGRTLWLADRNAHAILRVSLENGEIRRVPIGE